MLFVFCGHALDRTHVKAGEVSQKARRRSYHYLVFVWCQLGSHSTLMKQCPSCGREADVLVHNVQDGSEFCFACAPPSFDPRRILTMEDLRFLEQCGIDPDLPPVLRDLVEAVKNDK